MQPSKTPRHPLSFYQALPKVELHRHLEGSLRFDTIRELARSQGLDLPSTAQLKGMVQIQDDEPLTFENFLSKFTTLRLFYRSPEIIGRITREAIQDAANDNIRYLELRFTPVALSKAQDFPLERVIEWVIQGAKQAELDFGIKTRLIVSLNRHESLHVAAQVAYIAVERSADGIVALDLAGDEYSFSAEPFLKIFDHARKNGLHITIHAGEWNTGDNVLRAIEILGAERIGHGIRVLENAQAIAIASERFTPFEVCPTSNYQSGAVSTIESHPIIKMHQQGLNVTINTDDPSISNITLSDEYRLVCEKFGFRTNELRQVVLGAANAAFLPDNEKQELVNSIASEFPLQE